MQPLTWKPPIATATPSAAKLPRDRHGARELVRLDADQADHAGVPRPLDAPGDAPDRNLRVHFVVGVDLDRDVLAENFPLGAILSDGIERSHGIGRNPGLPPLDHIAVLVVMGRFHDLDMECRHCAPPAGRRRRPLASFDRRRKRESRQPASTLFIMSTFRISAGARPPWRPKAWLPSPSRVAMTSPPTRNRQLRSGQQDHEPISLTGAADGDICRKPLTCESNGYG